MAEKYHAIAQEYGILNYKTLAKHVRQPYRTIVSTMRLLNLCPEAKWIIRTAGKDARLRAKLSPWMLDRIHVRANEQEQVRTIQELLST